MSISVVQRRPVGALGRMAGRMALVAGIHAGALYLIASSLGLVPALIEVEPPKITLAPQVVEPPEPPPAVPRPADYQPELHVPTPVAPAAHPDLEEPVLTQRNDDPPVIPDRVAPAHQPELIGVRMDARHPLSQPAYPQTDIRQGNEGTAEIEVYVLPSGRIGDARLVRSTGSPTLDQSALDEARRNWRMLPAMRDGQPYAQWHRLKVTFNLKNR